MGDAAVVFVVLVVLSAAVVVAVRLRNKSLAARRVPPDAKWTIEEHGDKNTNCYVVWLVKPGEDDWEVGSVPRNDPDFESKIEEIRCEAKVKMTAANSRG